MRIGFTSPGGKTAAIVAVAVEDGGKLGASAARLDTAGKGILTKAIKSSSRFSGKTKELLEVLAPAGVDAERVLLYGVGKPGNLKALDCEAIGGALLAHCNSIGAGEATVLVDDFKGAALSSAEVAARVALGARLRSYRFGKYKTKEKPEKKPSMKALGLQLEKAAEARKLYAAHEPVVEGVFTTRDIVSEPANVIYPASFVHEARKLEKLGVKVTALGEKEMRKLGMGALLGVGQGSDREPQLLILEWNGAGKGRGKSADKGPLAFVGKGVCFDTGGISIKPSSGMEDMKWDMGGAGVVLGLMHALAARKAKVNVVGICGLVENMPDGKAQRPGDIVTSMSGQTIEVLNTDAEGRLVLADAIWYVQEKFGPSLVVDLATLTGAVVVALGKFNAGLFANDDQLAKQIFEAGQAVGETCWRLPLADDYDRMIDSDAADMQNIGKGRGGGPITAAQFIQRFVKPGTRWAHIDIAGVTWSDKDKPTVPKGATAFGVRLLDHFVAENYEA